MNKKVFIILVSIIILTVVAVTLCVLYPYRIPFGCNNIGISVGCAKVDDDGGIKWTEGELNDTVWMSDDTWKLNKFAKLLRSLELYETSELPTDIQIVEIYFTHSTLQTREILEKMYVAYDFYTGLLYANKDGKWYLMKENQELNRIIVERMDDRLWKRWRGQSIYSEEEFPESDFENATFRYNLYWEMTDYPSVEEDGLMLSGFNNTDEVEINSREDAIKRAAEELGYDNPVAVTLYDETCGYYMAEIANDNGKGVVDINNGHPELIEPIFTVVMDDKGRTLEVYEGCTRTRPFWNYLTDDGQ